MEPIKNIEMIEEIIGGNIYSFSYNLLTNRMLIGIQTIDYLDGYVRRPKMYEIELTLANNVKYSVLEKPFGVAKIVDLKVSEGKHVEKSLYICEEELDRKKSYEEDVYDVKIKIWNDELNIKCKGIVFKLIADRKMH